MQFLKLELRFIDSIYSAIQKVQGNLFYLTYQIYQFYQMKLYMSNLIFKYHQYQIEIRMETAYKKFLNLVAKFLPVEKIYSSQSEIQMVWLNYILEAIILYSCIITSSKFYEVNFLTNQIFFLAFISVRLAIVVLYLFLRIKVLIIISKLIAIVSILTLRSNFLIIANFGQLIMGMIYYSSKQKKRGNFDSRLFLCPSIWKVLLIQLIQIFTTKTLTNGAKGQLANILLLSLGLFWASLNDYTYRIKTQRILKTLVLSVIILTLFIILLDSYQESSAFIKYGTSTLIIVGLIANELHQNAEDSKILFKNDYFELNDLDKTEFLKCLINAVEIGDQIVIDAFIEHNRNITNEANQQLRNCLKDNKIDRIASVKQYINILLSQTIIRNSTINELFLFYHHFPQYHAVNKFDPFDLSHIIRLNQIDEQIKSSKVKSNDFKYVQQKEQLLWKLGKAITSKHQYFFQYLLQHRIDLNVCQEIGEQILKLRDEFSLQNFQQIQNHFNVNTVKLLQILKRQVIHLPSSNYSNQQNTEGFKLINNETPIIIISANEDTVGQVVHLNPAATKLTGFTTHQIKGRNMSILLTEDYDEKHRFILEKNAEKINMPSNESNKCVQNVFIKTKSMYSVFVQIKITLRYSQTGCQWLVQMLPKDKCPRIIIDQNGKIQGVNIQASLKGFPYSSVNLRISKTILQQILVKKSIQIAEHTNICESFSLSRKVPYRLKLNKEFQKCENLLKLHILEIEDAKNQSLQHQCLNNFKIRQMQITDFTFNFNPASLVFSDTPIENRQIFQDNSKQLLIENVAKKEYGEDIKEVIYLNGILEFRENNMYNEEDEYKAHPNFQKKRQKSQRTLKNIDGKTFSENMSQINDKFPKYFLLMIILVIIGSIVFISSITATCIMILDIVANNQQALEMDRLKAYQSFQHSFPK